ncbi:hypothetical protein BV898_05018 [Hypsibius exemplaris]|uniref:Transmembrane protein n=1 Tax=Hypsibius exemplaris TaxID=2072580 RepID=A0A1W0X0G2_HYPEX|nr:hypothetical protein BV898_05018 [Hypsibius exemplaris]
MKDYRRKNSIALMKMEKATRILSNDETAPQKSPELQVHDLKFPTLLRLNIARYIVGYAIIVIEVTLCILMLGFQLTILKGFSYALFFLGITNGINLVVYALHVGARLTVMKDIVAVHDLAEEDGGEPTGPPVSNEIPWEGSGYDTPGRKLGAYAIFVISIVLLVTYTVWTALGIEYCYGIVVQHRYSDAVMVICLVLLCLLVVLGAIGLVTFVIAFVYSMKLSRQCSECCYPLSVSFDDYEGVLILA